MEEGGSAFSPALPCPEKEEVESPTKIAQARGYMGPPGRRAALPGPGWGCTLPGDGGRVCVWGGGGGGGGNAWCAGKWRGAN